MTSLTHLQRVGARPRWHADSNLSRRNVADNNGTGADARTVPNRDPAKDRGPRANVNIRPNIGHPSARANANGNAVKQRYSFAEFNCRVEDYASPPMP